MNEIGDDERLETSTGEVLRREVPLGPIPPEPEDIFDPVAWPFPMDSQKPAKPGIADIYSNVPETETITDLSELSYEKLLQAGVSENEARRLSGRSSPMPQQDPRSLAYQGHGPVAGAPMGGVAHESVYCPPSDDEILDAAATGISGPMASIWNQWKDCTACPLSKTRLQVVLGSGSVEPAYIFIGQAPGPQEDQNGGPFVGPAGQMLTSVLNDVEINRVSECYLMNTVACRPIEPTTGRVCPPSLSEIKACRPRFADQIKALLAGNKTKVIVLLGKEAYVDFFNKTEVENETFNLATFRVGPRLGWQDMRRRNVPKNFPRVYFTYHPSFIVRNGSHAAPEYPAWKQDFQAIKRWAVDGLLIKPRGQEFLA